MKKIDLEIVDDDFLDSYYNSIDSTRILSELNALTPSTKYRHLIDNFKNIVKASLDDIENKYLNTLSHLTNDERKIVKNIFDYTGHRKKQDFIGHFKKLNIKSCPFCNNNYVYFYNSKKGSRTFNTIATIEHYYPKAEYPHLSLSFYNLIPCCNVCNTKFKGSKKHVGNIHHPYRDDFDLHSKFRVTLESLEKLNVELKTDNEKCKNSIDRFQLKKVYQQHSDIAKFIWDKAHYYNDSRIDELHKDFFEKLGYSRDGVKNLVYANYLENTDINKNNHSKLTQDILKQFKLLDTITCKKKS